MLVDRIGVFSGLTAAWHKLSGYATHDGCGYILRSVFVVKVQWNQWKALAYMEEIWCRLYALATYMLQHEQPC